MSKRKGSRRFRFELSIVRVVKIAVIILMVIFAIWVMVKVRSGMG